MNKVVAGVMVVVVLVAAAALIYTFNGPKVPVATAPRQPASAAPSATPPPPAAAEEAPAVRHPIEQATTQAPPARNGEKPLPALTESDDTVRGAFGALFPGEALERFLVPDQLVRRWVIAVDNVGREQVPSQTAALQPVPGPFLVRSGGGANTIDRRNYARYVPVVRLLEQVDARRLVATYAHFYPLFQKQYEELGYPRKYFNDRVVEAIDTLLATPEPEGSVTLVQPKVLYQFEDPGLEALPAGQKAMIRMGPDNAARVKAKLREIRRALTGDGAPRNG